MTARRAFPSRMCRSIIALSLLLIAVRSPCQRDTTHIVNLSLLVGLAATDAGSFETIVKDVRLPPASVTPFRQTLAYYETRGKRMFIGLDFTRGRGRSTTDSAVAFTRFIDIGFYLGYCVLRRRKFDLAPDVGWRLSNYRYSADQEHLEHIQPIVNYGRSSLSAGLFARYGTRPRLVLHTGLLIPLGSGGWTDQLTGLNITEVGPVTFKGFIGLGIGFAVPGVPNRSRRSADRRSEEELEDNE